MNTSYLTLDDKIYIEETVINKSRFLVYATRACTAAEAQDFVAKIKKKHYDATHNCYAYVTQDGTKFSDDGEPSGTAGKPILNSLTQKGLFNVVAVVTRYFGGIKLGAGGLVRAYGGTVAELLNKTKFFTVDLCVDIVVNAPYGTDKAVLNAAQSYAVKTAIEYGDGLKITLTVKRQDAKIAREKIVDALNGKCEVKEGQPYSATI